MSMRRLKLKIKKTKKGLRKKLQAKSKKFYKKKLMQQRTLV